MSCRKTPGKNLWVRPELHGSLEFMEESSGLQSDDKTLQTPQPPLPPQVAKAFYPLPGVTTKPRPLGVDFYFNVETHVLWAWSEPYGSA